MSQSRKSTQRGYTVVEVLATMTLFAIGAAGVISMQKVTIQGGDDARHFDIATNIANQWAARLQRDSLFWTLPDSVNTAGDNFGSTLYLQDMPVDWQAPKIPTSVPPGATPTWGSSAYNLLGREVSPTGTEAIFCVQFREQWIIPRPAIGAFIRAEIRVVWGRLETPNIGTCSNLTNATLTSDKDKYHFVYVTTAVRENPAR